MEKEHSPMECSWQSRTRARTRSASLSTCCCCRQGHFAPSGELETELLPPGFLLALPCLRGEAPGVPLGAGAPRRAVGAGAAGAEERGGGQGGSPAAPEDVPRGLRQQLCVPPWPMVPVLARI